MALRSRSYTPPTTPLLMGEEVEETELSPRQDDPHSPEDVTSLFPVADVLDNAENTSTNQFLNSDEQILPSVPHVTPSIQSMLGRRYQPLSTSSRSILQRNTPVLRRNPVRLARSISPMNNKEKKQQNIPLHSRPTVIQLRSPSPLSADEEEQPSSTSTRFHEDLIKLRRRRDDSEISSIEKEKERSVSFPSTNIQVTNSEQTLPPTSQASDGVDSLSTASRTKRRLENSPKTHKYRTLRKEESKDIEKVEINKGFLNQLCQAFKVQDLDQLQQLLPYQPTPPQPSLSHAKEQTYYENDLVYNVASSGESASEISDEEGQVLHRLPAKAQRTKYHSKANTNARAFLSQREKPLRGKWIPPAHLPQLDESIEDYDLWFQQMHQYLLQSCITQPADQRYLTQLHCDWDFFEAIVTRAKGLGISKESLCGSRRAFRDFVCTYYTRPEALREVQDELRNLGRKDLSVKEVWQELRRLFMSHDAKARRQGYPELTDQQKVEYLIDSLRPRVQFLMSWLRRQRHPDLATPSTAYAAALLCEKDLQKLDTTGQATVADSAWLTPSDTRGQVCLPMITQQSNTWNPIRKSISNTDRFTKQRSSATPRYGNAQEPQGVNQMCSITSPPTRQKRAFGDLTPREKTLCAFCLNEGHIAFNCRRRRRALEHQLHGQHQVVQRKFEPRRSFAMAAPQLDSQRLPEQQYLRAQQSSLQRSSQKQSGQTQRPTFRPTCAFCNKTGHEEIKCWIKYPHLKSKFPRQTGTTSLQGRSNFPRQTGTRFLQGRPDFPHQTEAIPLQGRAQLGAITSADKSLPMEEVHHVSLDPWRNPIASQRHQASLAFVSTQSSSEHQSEESKNDSNSEIEHKRKVRQRSLCRCLPTLRVVANNQILHIIVDTGATINLINTNIAKAMHTKAAAEPISVSDISGNLQKLNEVATVPLELGGYPYVFDFYVTPTLPGDALLGMDAIIEAGWIVDPIDRLLLHKTHALPPIRLHPCVHESHMLRTKQKCTLAPMTWHKVPVIDDEVSFQSSSIACILLPFPPPTLAVHGAPTFHNTTDQQKFILLCNMSQDPIDIPVGAIVAHQEIAQDLERESVATTVLMDSGFSASAIETRSNVKDRYPQVDKLKHSTQQVVEKYFDLSTAKELWDIECVKSLKRLLLTMAVTWMNPDIVGRAIRGEHRINTQDAQPIALPLRRIAWIEKDKIKQEIDKMRQQGIIEDSESPWCSPPVLVRKKDGSVRFCIDYRRLNEVTVPDKYPLPRIDDVLDALSQGHYFSVIDLKSGYWQIPMHKSDAEKTAFRTYEGLYQFTVMPFGLRNAPATFQRLMDTVLSGLKWKGLLVYMDDIIIYSATAQEHLVTLADTLERLANAGLKINPSKTTLVRHEVNYLGHVISAQGISPNPDKIAAIRNLKPPSSVREVRMFLGLTGYFRKFVEAYAILAGPLYALTKKHAHFHWTDQHQTGFELLKQKLCTAPVLAYPRRHRKSIVDCDASDVAAGAVLLQLDEAGNEYVVQYISCTFNETQRRWPTVEREAYAIVWAITTFRPYLLGLYFIVRTDNSAAAAIKTARQPKLQRWSVTLAEYDFTVEYRPGKRHTHVDALSRLSVKDTRGVGAPHIDLPEEATVDAAYPEHCTLPITDWKTAQNSDPDYCIIRNFLQTGRVQTAELPHWFRILPSSKRSRFLIDNTGIVIRGDDSGKRTRWLVPQSLQQTLIKRSHSGSQGAHLGATKLFAQLSLKYYWPQMLDTIRDFIKACDRCQRVKAAPRIHRTSRILNREALWSTVAFDFFGPLRKTARGNVYILVGIDHFSRWPEAIATRVANAETVASFMHNKIISQHGSPSELLSDHGTHFTSHVISLLCRKYGIRRLMSTPYTPQSNGIVERFMGYLKTALITLIDRVPTAWDLHLSVVLAAYRATPHPDSGESPFYLNKGYDPRLPEEVALDTPLPASSTIWHEQLTTARTALENKIANEQEVIASKVKEESAYQFGIGQLVLVKRTAPELQQAQTKLTDKYDHLARIKAILPNLVTYEITYLRTGETAIINRRNLKPFYQATDDEDDVLQPPFIPSLSDFK